MSQVLVLNGPNLNLLGRREPGLYGADTLPSLEASLHAEAEQLGVSVAFYQSNSEGELVDRIQRASEEGTRFAIINAGAYTHTSVALRDAFLGVSLPFIEVHISNVFAREAFRHHSFLSDVASGVIVGLGTQGYSLALRAAAEQLRQSER